MRLTNTVNKTFNPLQVKAWRKFSALLLAGSLGLTSLPAMAEVEDILEKNYPFSSKGRLELSNINGDVSITTCDCQQLSLKATIKASSQKARDRITIEITDSESQIKIKTRHASSHGFWNNDRVSVDYQLTVPKSTEIDNLELVNGDLNLTNLDGDLDLELVNGNITSKGLAGSARIELVNGDARLGFAKLDARQKVKIESVNGDIKVYLPESASVQVEAESVTGGMDNEFNLEVIEHRYVGSEMRGTIGGGDAVLQVESVNGDISIGHH